MIEAKIQSTIETDGVVRITYRIFAGTKKGATWTRGSLLTTRSLERTGVTVAEAVAADLATYAQSIGETTR